MQKSFKKTNPKILEKIEEFWESKLQPRINELGNPKLGGTSWKQIIEAELLKEENTKYLSALKQYNNLRQEVLSISRDELVKNHQVVADNLIQKSRVTIGALNVTTQQKPSTNLEKTYAKKMSQVKGSKFNEI